MDVTQDNFEEAFTLFQESLALADFVTFDTEFSGFSIFKEDKGHDYDSIEDRY